MAVLSRLSSTAFQLHLVLGPAHRQCNSLTLQSPQSHKHRHEPAVRRLFPKPSSNSRRYISQSPRFGIASLCSIQPTSTFVDPTGRLTFRQWQYVSWRLHAHRHHLFHFFLSSLCSNALTQHYGLRRSLSFSVLDLALARFAQSKLRNLLAAKSRCSRAVVNQRTHLLSLPSE